MSQTYIRQALGTTCSLVSQREKVSGESIELFNGLIDELDKAASRFRSDSELNALCRGPEKRDVVISELLFGALSAALYGAKISGGYLDPTVGSSLAALGYKSDFSGCFSSSPEGLREIKVSLPAGYKRITLTSATRSVSLPEKVQLDLGATGKAYLADLIRERIESELSDSVLVNLGGDISASAVDRTKCWLINITDDNSLDADAPGVVIGIVGGGVATSSTNRRAWTAGRIKLHHIVDPFTGASASSPFSSVTVLAGSALDANVASSTTIAMGVAGADWLESTGLPALTRDKLGKEQYFGGWSDSAGIRRCG